MLNRPFLPVKLRISLFLFWGMIILPITQSNAQVSVSTPPPPYAKQKSSNQWADSLLKTLSFRDMVAQTFMIPAWSRSAEMDPMVVEMVQKYRVGGIIYFQGHPLTHAYSVNFLQQQSKIPLIIGMDAEWGAAMRIESLSKFPFALSIAAQQNTDYAYRVGNAIGKQLKLLGVHINFAPVVDINSDPNNPVIGVRSFGDQPQLVTDLAIAYNKGLEDAGVFGCAKHFPGHGNTIADSHKELPLVTHTPSSLQKDILPFEALIKEGVKSVMVGHLRVPLLDTAANMPSSLSKAIVTDLLRDELKFKGLIITDALNMKGITSHYSNIDAAIRALNAGNDILCFVENIPALLDTLVKLKDSGRFDSLNLAHSVRRILIAKHQLGLAQYTQINVGNIEKNVQDIYREFAESSSESNLLAVQESHPQKSIVLLGNKQNVVPVIPNGLDTSWLVCLGKSLPNELYLRCQQYATTSVVWAHQFPSVDSLYQFISPKKGIKICFNGLQRMWSFKPREIPEDLLQLLHKSTHRNDFVFIHTGNVYALQKLSTDIPIILGMETSSAYLLACVDGLFGQYNITGNLPVKINEKYHNGSTFQTRVKQNPFKGPNFKNPNIKPETEVELYMLADEVMQNKAAESMQLLVIKDDEVLYNISRGSYNAKFADTEILTTVNQHTVYDLASISKVAATTLAVMKLQERFGFKVNEPIGKYWKEARDCPWGNLPIQDFLLHRSGLPAFLPLWNLVNSKPHLRAINVYDSTLTDSIKKLYSWKITPQLALRPETKDSVWEWTKKTKPASEAAFVYSDINAIILGKFVESLCGMNLARFCEIEFYEPMGLRKTGFLPKARGLTPWIPPTAVDSLWPRGTIRAEVHDPSALLFGGFAGNAGLFSSANELAQIMSMLLHEGEYNGQNYLKASTIKQYTKAMAVGDNYRGLGFDKPNGYPNKSKQKNAKGSNLFDNAPLSIFGHAGFTGTWAWADPEENLIFIFLSNRTYPNDNVNILAKKGYRGKMMEAVYRGLK